MTLLAIGALSLIGATTVLFCVAYGMVRFAEYVARCRRRRLALEPFVRRLHDLLAEHGHDPVTRRSGGRHRLTPNRNRDRVGAGR